MPSQSVIASSAAEARFRVQAPNSSPRALKVIALDARSEAVVRRLASEPWNRASFFVADGNGSDGASDALRDLNGERVSLADEIRSADLVVMIAAAGETAPAAAAIGRASSERRVMTTALIIESAAASEESLSRTLAQVRPWSLMLVMAQDDSYIADMMTALRA